MKIAVTANGPKLDDKVEPHFMWCPYFVIIDPDTMDLEPVENPNLSLTEDAAIQSAQVMSEHGVEVILTGDCEQNIFQVCVAARIHVIVGVSGTVNQAVNQFKNNAFSDFLRTKRRRPFQNGN